MTIGKGLAAALAAAALAGPAAAETVEPWRAVAVLDGDWKDDGRRDRAVLLQADGMADLLIYVGGERPGSFELVEAGRGIAWHGGAWGTIPSLETSPSGGIRVLSQNEAIGRNRWHQALTIAYRGGRFVVAGFTYNAFDTLDPAAGTDCDVNLLTGKGLLNGEPFATAARALPVSDWTEDAAPRECFR
ncbi:hypothetical protein LNKW23_44800 [Paralimibaculum aggregatum]|uniref:Uncharacterized protein n=1 Tax=Paralimibaculum aggregatum TaxID=3036245 RepID=A0ABQ6LT49_9RHOB|nr:hypothetical protein [Limibaculum sp. NKW23]GMG85262.1 hypothetical protein LNKW23_44800 [Limibaculum sp. NKW23]